MKQPCPLFIASKRYPSQICFVEGGRRITFSQANELVGGLAEKLSSMKLGSRVSVISKNNLEMILLVFALQRLEVSVVLHNTRLRVEDWKGQIKLAGVGQGFVSSEFRGLAPFEELLLPELDLGAEYSAEIDYQKEAVVIFTSGSTGRGKGVRLSLGNLMSNVEASNQVNDLMVGDTWLVTLPFFHVGGLCIVFRTILAGASTLITHSQSTREIFSQLDNVSHVSLIPSVLAEILDFDGGYQKLNKLKNILLGGAPSDLKLLEKIVKLPVRTSYGMSETSSHICMLEKNEVLQVEDLKTSGKLFEGVKVKISEEGEICLKGPSIFKGYLGEKEQAADDWFFTGDLGSLDSKGVLTVEGRKDRVIISGGENINPKQIEDLALSCQGVKEAVVVGVDDPKWGKRPVLYIVEADNFSTDRLVKILEEKLPKFKIPDRIVNLEALPKTATGKIDYKRLVD